MNYLSKIVLPVLLSITMYVGFVWVISVLSHQTLTYQEKLRQEAPAPTCDAMCLFMWEIMPILVKDRPDRRA